MAITGRVLTSGTSTVNQSTPYLTESITPAADAVLVLVVGYSVASGVAADPVITGLGLTWEEFVSSESSRAIAIWRAKGTGTTGQIAIAPSGGTYTSCYWTIIEFVGADLESTIGQVAVANATTDVPSLSLADPIADGAATVAGFITSVQTTAEPRIGWTEAADLNNSAPTSTVHAQYKIPGEQTASATFAASGICRAVLVSVRAASTTAVVVVTGSGDATASSTGSGSGRRISTGSGDATASSTGSGSGRRISTGSGDATASSTGSGGGNAAQPTGAGSGNATASSVASGTGGPVFVGFGAAKAGSTGANPVSRVVIRGSGLAKATSTVSVLTDQIVVSGLGAAMATSISTGGGGPGFQSTRRHYIGDKEIATRYIGDESVLAVYQGAVLIWTS